MGIQIPLSGYSLAVILDGIFKEVIALKKKR
jgi:hypothetical protein